MLDLGILAAVWGAFAVALHTVGVRREWYGAYWWFDHVTHTVSGAGVALWLVLIGRLTVGAHWWVVFPGFAALALAWEAYEYLAGTPRHMWHSVRNMTYDLTFGGFAATVVWVVVA